MTNGVLLKCQLVQKGMTVLSLCQKCGFSPAYFYKCLRGEQEFRTNEVKAVAVALELSAKEITDIFFAGDVAD